MQHSRYFLFTLIASAWLLGPPATAHAGPVTLNPTIGTVQLAGADSDNHYALFAGQPLATGPAEVISQKGSPKPLRFTRLSGPAGLTVDANTGAIRYQPPATAGLTGGGAFSPFQIRVTDGTSTFEVAGTLEQVAVQQEEKATANGVMPIRLGTLAEMDADALPVGTTAILRVGTTAAGEAMLEVTIPRPLAKGRSLRLNSDALNALPKVVVAAKSCFTDKKKDSAMPQVWQPHAALFYDAPWSTGEYRLPHSMQPNEWTVVSGAVLSAIDPNRFVSRIASTLCAENALGSAVLKTDAQPVLFVHGYMQLRELGGGSGSKGTWDQMVKELKARMGSSKILPFEFRWRTNARFEDAAGDLEKAVARIKLETGKSVHLIAHSFGGLLARTYLQGLAATDSGYVTPVASLTTVGTPHSGIFGESNDEHPLGVDDSWGGEGLGLCGQLSCFQAGHDMEDDDLVKELLGTSVPGSIIRDLENSSHPFVAVNLPVQVLIGLRTEVLEQLIRYTDGDGLIAFEGQRFLPTDRKQKFLRRSESISGLGGKVSEYVIDVDTTNPSLSGVEVDSATFPGFAHIPEFTDFLDSCITNGVCALKAEVFVENSNHEVLPYLEDFIRNSTTSSSYLLTVTTGGTGSGWVSGGGHFAAGTTVTLTATPATGSTFTGWSPSPCAASFVMPANTLTCVATFTKNGSSTFSYPVAKTGQTLSYAARDDGDLERGVAWPNPRFTDAGNGSVTDRLTGILWLKNAHCDGYKTWADATTWAARLANGQCGLTDGSRAGQWRLPTIVEWHSLINRGAYSPPLPAGHPFTNVDDYYYYWSSTPVAYAGTDDIWGFSMASSGWNSWMDRTGAQPSWAVRTTTVAGAPAPVAPISTLATNHFKDNNNGTVTDTLTGLVWLKKADCSSGRSVWNTALTWTAGLASGQCGLTDGSTAGQWRLPNVNELRSLVDYTRSGYPVLPTGHPFSGVQSSRYWSSTAYASITSYAWYVHLDDGYVSYNDRAGTYDVWPVRGGL